MTCEINCSHIEVGYLMLCAACANPCKAKRQNKCDVSMQRSNLIQKILHHPDFNVDDVDHDMHKRLMHAVALGDFEVIEAQVLV